MSGLVTVLAVIGGATLSLVTLFVVVAVVRKLAGRRLPRHILLELTLDGDIAEHVSDAPLRRLLAARGRTLRQIVDGLDKAARDPRVVGLIARVEPEGLGLAQLQELRDALLRFRAHGKPTFAWADTYGEGSPGNAAYYLATALEHVFVQPSGDVSIAGLSIEQPFVRRALDRLGVRLRVGQREAFKTAPNMFTETGLTPAHKEQLDGLSTAILDELVRGISEARGLPPEEVRRLFAAGPFFAAQALEHRLVDGVAYRDEVYARAQAKVGERAKLLYFHKYLPKAKRPKVKGTPPRVALIYGVGAVQRGESSGTERGEAMHSETIAAAFRAAVKDKKVKGIVFRVDSPGGSYVASDTIWREVVRAREANRPVVVSMGNYAASGGYFVAAPATAIVAQPATLTGSIGVFGGKPVVVDLARKLGIDFEGVQTSANATQWSVTRDYSDDQWARMQQTLDRIYDDFIGKVAAGRRLDRATVRELAQGKVWTGRQALEVKLVDELGGLDAAFSRLKKELGVADDQRVSVRELPAKRSLLERLRREGPRSSEGEGVLAGLLELAAWLRLARPLRSELEQLVAAEALRALPIRAE